MLVRPNPPSRTIIPTTMPPSTFSSSVASGSRLYLFIAVLLGIVILFSSFWDFQTLASSTTTVSYHNGKTNDIDAALLARLMESSNKAEHKLSKASSNAKSSLKKMKKKKQVAADVDEDDDDDDDDSGTTETVPSVVRKKTKIAMEEDETEEDGSEPVTDAKKKKLVKEDESEDVLEAEEIDTDSCTCPSPSSLPPSPSPAEPSPTDTSATMDRRNPFTMPIPKIDKTPHFLNKRPPRRPPVWLENGECPDVSKPEDLARFVYSPLADFPIEALRMDAFNSFTEEHSGDILLGDCECPLLDPSMKPFPEWQFDCGAHDWRILSELAPWHGLNITHALIDLAARMNTANIPPTYHVAVKNNQFYMKVQTQISVYHENLLSMLRTVGKSVKLPDAEFVMHYWDHAKVPRGDAMPVFGWSHEASRADITSPFSMYWNRLGEGFNALKWYPDTCPAFEERREKVVWRGGCMGQDHGAQKELIPAYKRTRLNFLTEKYPDLIDAGVNGDSDCGGDAYLPKPSHVNLYTGEDLCKHKYLLLIDGNGCSGRSSLLFGSGSVVFKPDSPLSEFFYHGLIPWVHYVPVREFLEDLPEQVQWIKDHPKAAKCIAENGRRFARQHLNEATVICYWWRLLSAWARQQVDPARTDAAGLLPV